VATYEGESLSIAETAIRGGLSAHTLRYYERVGLLDPIERGASGHRRFSAADLTWIAFLQRLRATGMPIREMQQYAELRRQGDQTIAARRELLEQHQQALRERLTRLHGDLEALETKIHHYRALEARDARP
jgi:DNA-binding transcriptional MerR regulator